MFLGIRKLIVLAVILAVFLLGNVWMVVNWLQEHGVVDLAQHLRTEYLTGTALAVIIALLILLARPGSERCRMLRRCSVCDHVLWAGGKYCNDCGSKV